MKRRNLGAILIVESTHDGGEELNVKVRNLFVTTSGLSRDVCEERIGKTNTHGGCGDIFSE